MGNLSGYWNNAVLWIHYFLSPQSFWHC